MKHTSGKWEVYQETDVVYVATKIAEEMHIIATAESQLDGLNNDEKIKEQQANAHLIAAAPELLYALKKISKELRTNMDRFKMIEAIENLTNTALAKVEEE